MWSIQKRLYVRCRHGIIEVYSPLTSMDTVTIAHVVCSAILSLCLLIQTLPFAHYTLYTHRCSKQNGQLEQPAIILIVSLCSNIVTAVIGLAYCCSNDLLRSEGSPYAVSSTHQIRTGGKSNDLPETRTMPVNYL